MFNPKSWTCIMHQNGPSLIEDDVKEVICLAACRLFEKGGTQFLFGNAVCNGLIKTDREYYRIQLVGGILFETELTTPTVQDYRVNFLLSEADLQRGAQLIANNPEAALLYGNGWEEAAMNPNELPLERLTNLEPLSRRTKH